MNHDVFISYSKKDAKRINPLRDALTAAGIKYWIDDRIDGSENFLAEIPDAIRKCSIVLFVASQNSANSEWTQKELVYARKLKKEIFPYKLDDFQFENCAELDFFFTNIQWKENVEEVVAGLAKKLGVKVLVQPKITIPASVSVPKKVAPRLVLFFVLGVLSILVVVYFGILREQNAIVKDEGVVGCDAYEDNNINVEVVTVEKDKLSSQIISSGTNKMQEKSNKIQQNPTKQIVVSTKTQKYEENASEKNSNSYLLGSSQNITRQIAVTAKDQELDERKIVISNLSTTPIKQSNKVEQNNENELVKPDAEAKIKEEIVVKDGLLTQSLLSQGNVEQDLSLCAEVQEMDTMEDSERVENYEGKSDRDKYLLSLPDKDFVSFTNVVNGLPRYGYKLKSTKQIVIPAKFSAVGHFCEGLAFAKEKMNGKWGFLDKTGSYVILAMYDKVHDFKNGLARVKLNGRWGYIDKTGKVVISMKYDNISDFIDGLAIVKLEGKYGLIDKEGKNVTPIKYNEITRNKNGEIKVWLNDELFYIDKNGNRIE